MTVTLETTRRTARGADPQVAGTSSSRLAAAAVVAVFVGTALFVTRDDRARRHRAGHVPTDSTPGSRPPASTAAPATTPCSGADDPITRRSADLRSPTPVAVAAPTALEPKITLDRRSRCSRSSSTG